MTTITLTADGAWTVNDESTVIPRAWMTDDALTFDAKGLLVYLATLPAGTHDLDDIADRNGYVLGTLTAIANELAWAGYAEITGGDA